MICAGLPSIDRVLACALMELHQIRLCRRARFLTRNRLSRLFRLRCRFPTRRGPYRRRRMIP